MAEAPDIPERLEGSVRVADEQALRRLFEQPLDFGCRPSATPEPDGGFTVPVIGSPQALEELKQQEGFEVRVLEPPKERAAVGEGDRFEGGTVLPRGFGRQILERGDSD
ncbi:MAG TPA: hypothetical protein VLD16_07510 [Gaiellaceae bacterium]|nr:hypothetical protein [Gaiellaceae bacterium]